MSEELNFVSDLALILISAGVITIVFKLLKQPLVLGYIVAGFFVGPHFKLIPTVIETQSVQQWSEIGIIFLLFALGLEFSFKKLFKVGSTAFISAGFGIITTFCIAFLTGYLMNWSTMECIFLGGMLSMSSTTIIIKAFDDLGIKKQRFSDITLVILILQDLVAIIMMVMLSTAAVGQHFSSKEMMMSLVKLVFFLILWFIIGITIIPTFFKKTKKFVNDETLLIISIGLCFSMVTIANLVGFSSALGAFVMGSILSETIEGEHIEKLIKGIKDLFGAIFFVSVGMMVDPTILITYWQPILVLTLITIFIKTFLNSMGVVISGESLKVSMQVGFSLAQIGEFAFIIAALGVSLGVMHNYIYGIIVAVSVITTFTTPYCIRAAIPSYAFIYKRLSPKIKHKLDQYQVKDNYLKQESDWKTIFKVSLPRLLIFGVICFAIVSISFKIFYPFMAEKYFDIIPNAVINAITAGGTIIALAPFLYGLMSNKQKTREIYIRLSHKSRLNRTGLLALTLMRIFMATFFVIIVLTKSFKFTPWLIVIIALTITFFILASRRILRRFLKIENHFMNNLNAKEKNQENTDYIETV